MFAIMLRALAALCLSVALGAGLAAAQDAGPATGTGPGADAPPRAGGRDLQAVDLTTVVSPREVCFSGGREYSLGAVIFVQMPRGCTREGTRILKMAETQICALAGDRPAWTPLYDIPLRRVTEEVGANCEW